MSYLIRNDFKKFIQENNLDQIINKDPSILLSAMLDAQEEAKEYLVQKFVLDQEFADSKIYDPTLIYNPGDRVYLDASAFNPASTYVLGKLVLNTDENVYICSLAVTTPGAFNLSDWTLLGLQFTVFSVPFPKPLFILNAYYKTGNQVFWNGKTYTCIIPTSRVDHSLLIQYNYTANIPSLNVFPDDASNGIQYWGIGTTSPVTANTLPGPPWINGDNRNRGLVRACVNIALFIMHMRISPRNIPELRVMLYMGNEKDRIVTKDSVIYPDYCALGWLQSAAVGNKTSGLQVIQPRSGGQVRWGSRIRNENGF